uniref:ATP-dependent DNA helicase n=1 Tax=Rhizophagus irregularis (strain DAOM 181602 / DAOM 197198 / MUCL 43194) TaxID=747089 RepID=U9UN62_RHIID
MTDNTIIISDEDPEQEVDSSGNEGGSQEEQEYDIEELLKLAKDDFSSLNTEQQAIFDEVIKAVETKTPAIFFVNGPEGTGKTFLYSNLLAKVRLEKRIALAVASSGIAAFHLPGG